MQLTVTVTPAPGAPTPSLNSTGTFNPSAREAEAGGPL